MTTPRTASTTDARKRAQDAANPQSGTIPHPDPARPSEAATRGSQRHSGGSGQGGNDSGVTSSQASLPDVDWDRTGALALAELIRDKAGSCFNMNGDDTREVWEAAKQIVAALTPPPAEPEPAPVTRTYGHGCIGLTYYPSSQRIGVVQTGTNAVMDTSDLLEFVAEMGVRVQGDDEVTVPRALLERARDIVRYRSLGWDTPIVADLAALLDRGER